MEKVLGFHHESWTVKVVQSEETEVGRLLFHFRGRCQRTLRISLKASSNQRRWRSWCLRTRRRSNGLSAP